jgi:hypothetical protein
MAKLYMSLKTGDDTDNESKCFFCGRNHPTLWEVHRKIIAQFGHFPVVRLSGMQLPIDGTLPTRIDKLPNDAVWVPPARHAELWHGTGHYFG